MRRGSSLVVYEAPSDAVRKMLESLNSSGDELLTLEEAWNWVQPSIKVRGITFELLKQMFERVSTQRNKSTVDIRDLLIATSQRYARSREHYPHWMQLVRACNPPDANLELKVCTTGKNILDVTQNGHGQPFRISAPVDPKVLPYKDSDDPSTSSSTPKQSSAKSPASQKRCLITYTFLEKPPEGSPTSSDDDNDNNNNDKEEVAEAAEEELSKDRATAGVASSKRKSLSNKRGLSVVSMSGSGSGSGSASGSASASSPTSTVKKDDQQGYTYQNAKGQLVKVKAYFSPKQRLLSLHKKKDDLLTSFREEQMAGAGKDVSSSVAKHPMPFQTKFRVIDRLSFQMDRSRFFDPEPHNKRPGLLETRTLEDPDVPFLTKFGQQPDRNLSKGSQIDLGNDNSKRFFPHCFRDVDSNLPSFTTAIGKRTKTQAFATGEFFPTIGNERKTFKEMLTIEEFKQLQHRAKRIGVKLVPISASNSEDALSQGRVHHSVDWRGPLDIRKV